MVDVIRLRKKILVPCQKKSCECGKVWRAMTDEERSWNAKANPDTVQTSSTDEPVQETEEASAPKTSKKKKKVVRKKVVRKKKKSSEASATASE